MNFDLLINIFDSHNEASILLTEKYKPSNVLFFYMSGHEVIHLEKLKSYYAQKFPRCKFDYQKLDIDKPDEIEKFITSYKDVEGVCNLTSGKKLATIMIYTFCIKHNIDCRYVDIKNEMIIELSSNGVRFEANSFFDLDVEDIIKSIGASIIVESTDSYSDEAILEFSNWISQNIDKWDILKSMLQDTSIFVRDENNPNFLKVVKNKIKDENKEFLLERLKFLDDKNQIKLKEEDDIYKIYFENDFIKTFLFKSGTWLEIMTQKVVEDLENIDDVKSGLLFLWDNDKTNVRNELDVVAVKDSVMICISCKDSKKYDECALNELNVYANKIGGENVIKILVATKEPMKGTVLQRAKEMNINIVIFNGEMKKFKNNLANIINQKRETS